MSTPGSPHSSENETAPARHSVHILVSRGKAVFPSELSGRFLARQRRASQTQSVWSVVVAIGVDLFRRPARRHDVVVACKRVEHDADDIDKHFVVACAQGGDVKTVDHHLAMGLQCTQDRTGRPRGRPRLPRHSPRTRHRHRAPRPRFLGNCVGRGLNILDF